MAKQKKKWVEEPTMHLRWRGDVLQQLWEVRGVGLKWLTNSIHYEWRPVPRSPARFEYIEITDVEQEKGKNE